MTEFNWQATTESRRYGLITEEMRYQAFKNRLLQELSGPGGPFQQKPLSMYDAAQIMQHIQNGS